MNSEPDPSAAHRLGEPQDGQVLSGLVIVVAGATGAAGPPLVERLARAGATVVAAGSNRERIGRVVADVTSRVPSDRVQADVVDLLDEQVTRDWAAGVEREHGRVDGLVHLVGGWRGGAGIVDADLADWDWLQDRLIRTFQHTSRAFHDAIKASPRGRLVLISTPQTRAPSATNASYAAAKAAAEAWTLAVADSFKDSDAAAVILQISALLTPAMRAAKPDATFAGYTPVDQLAETIHDLWLAPASQLNGQRL
jgi:NAD(P)-dependent dehydrogenase (short-subunit alcohol dehydrogenase family)